MRTVTFSDAKVAAALAKDFACTWKNIRPQEKFDERDNKDLDEMRSGRANGEVLSEGTGATNICSIFALPDGRIVHAVSGNVKPGTFLQEAAFALKAARAAAEEQAREKLKALYEVRLKEDPARILRPLRSLAASPLPSIDSLLKADRAGLR